MKQEEFIRRAELKYGYSQSDLISVIDSINEIILNANLTSS